MTKIFHWTSSTEDSLRRMLTLRASYGTKKLDWPKITKHGRISWAQGFLESSWCGELKKYFFKIFPPTIAMQEPIEDGTMTWWWSPIFKLIGLGLPMADSLKADTNRKAS